MKSLVINALGNKRKNAAKDEELKKLTDKVVESIVNRPKHDSSEFDNLIREEKLWLQEYPQGEEWRDMKDQVIDDRDFSQTFKEKVKFAKQYVAYLKASKRDGLIGSHTQIEAKETVSFEFSRQLLKEVVEELAYGVVEDVFRTKTKALDLLSKIVLNAVMDINEGNKRYLKQTGKISLLRGATVDFTTNRNNFLGTKEEQEEEFKSCIVYDLDELLVVQKAQGNEPEPIQRKAKKENYEKIHFFNASFPIHQDILQRQLKLEIDYWENVTFKPMAPFKYDNNYGKITVARFFSDSSFAEHGSVLMVGTSLGRILAWKITFQPPLQQPHPSSPNSKKGNSNKKTVAAYSLSPIELIAYNPKQKGEDALPITDFKLPFSQPNAIITINSQNVVTVWNLKFIFNEEKFTKERTEFFDQLNQENNFKSLFNLLNCFALFWDSKKFTIVIEKLYTIIEDDLSFQPFYSSRKYELYPIEPKTSFQSMMDSLGGNRQPTRLSSETIFKKEKEELIKQGKILIPKKNDSKNNGKSNNNDDQDRDYFIDRHVPTIFAHFRNLGYREGEPESILIGTNDGYIFKINLDLLSKISETIQPQFHQSGTAIRNHLPVTGDVSKQPLPAFVEKEFVNPNIAPEGFILAVQERANNPSKNRPTNSVFREIFKFHESPLLLLESFTMTTNSVSYLQEKIISLDSTGKLVLWDYSPNYFQGACWFVPEVIKQLSFQFMDFETVSEGVYQEFEEKKIDFSKLQCISIDETTKVIPPAAEEETPHASDSPVKAANLIVAEVFPIQINKTSVFYPIYSEKEKKWIQYELYEGKFRRKSKRAAATQHGHTTHRKSSAFLIAAAAAGNAGGGGGGSANVFPRSPTLTNTNSESPRDNPILASKVASKLRNTIQATFNQNKSYRENIVQPKIGEMEFMKAQVTFDRTEILFLFYVPSTSNSNANQNIKKYSIHSVLTRNLVCSHPSCQVQLFADEKILDFAATSVLEETFARNVFLLTDKRVLVYSFTNEEITTKLKTKPVLSKQKLVKDFQLPESFEPLKLLLCPSNKVLAITSNRKPFICIYHLEVKKTKSSSPRASSPPSSPQQNKNNVPFLPSLGNPSRAKDKGEADLLQISERDQLKQLLKKHQEEHKIPWVRSEEELKALAIKTVPEVTAVTAATIESLLEDIHEYAVSVVLDGIIKKLEAEHEEFQKQVVETFFDDNLGFIPPTTWPLPLVSDENSHSGSIKTDSSKQSRPASRSEPKVILVEPKSSESKENEEKEEKELAEKSSEAVVSNSTSTTNLTNQSTGDAWKKEIVRMEMEDVRSQQLRSIREMQLMSSEETLIREISCARRELQLMQAEDRKES